MENIYIFITPDPPPPYSSFLYDIWFNGYMNPQAIKCFKKAQWQCILVSITESFSSSQTCFLFIYFFCSLHTFQYSQEVLFKSTPPPLKINGQKSVHHLLLFVNSIYILVVHVPYYTKILNLLNTWIWVLITLSVNLSKTPVCVIT